MTDSALHILVADDHTMMREGIALMVDTEWPGSVCHFANDYASVIAQLDSQSPISCYDAVVLDLRMPGMRGADSVAQISQRAGTSPVLVCTALDDPGLLDRLDATGVFAVVNKAAGSQEFLNLLRLALAQPPAPCNTDAERATTRPMALMECADSAPGLMQNGQNGQSAQCGSAMLTRRQRDILKLLHQGKPSKVIADHMGIGLGTVKTHLHTLYTVMGVASRTQAIAKSQGWML